LHSHLVVGFCLLAEICPQRTGNFTSMVRMLALLSKDFQFYEMEDPDLGAPNQQVEEKV
jgi:hypothetical protein